MADSAKNEKAAKPSFWKGVKAEFKKISWPDKDALLKQSIAVVCISIVLGAIIAVLDFLMQYGVDFLTSLQAFSDCKKGLVICMAEANWYVVHTYSGYENKVKANIEKTIENRHLEEEILEVRVPMQDVVELKNGAKKTVQKKMFPGYVLINMIMNDDTWYVVRNTRGVTGFVGPGSKPVPLSEAEMKPLGIKTENVSVDFTEGDTIAVVAGVWKDTVGVVQRMDFGKQTATINVELFGRETPVEISFAEVRRMS